MTSARAVAVTILRDRLIGTGCLSGCTSGTSGAERLQTFHSQSMERSTRRSVSPEDELVAVECSSQQVPVSKRLLKGRSASVASLTAIYSLGRALEFQMKETFFLFQHKFKVSGN
eukprot:5774925-Amphidinium_carterae.1